MHYIQFIHITLGLNPFHHPHIQTWPLCRAHTIFGQRAFEVIHWCEFECDSGSRQSLLRRSRWCLLRAGRLAKPAGRAGWAELPVAPAISPLEMARRREIPQIRRQPGKPDHKLLTSAAPQQPSLSRTDCLWGCAQGSDCLRLPVNKRQSQQATMQWHLMVSYTFISLFSYRQKTATCLKINKQIKIKATHFSL